MIIWQNNGWLIDWFNPETRLILWLLYYTIYTVYIYWKVSFNSPSNNNALVIRFISMNSLIVLWDRSHETEYLNIFVILYVLCTDKNRAQVRCRKTIKVCFKKCSVRPNVFWTLLAFHLSFVHDCSPAESLHRQIQYCHMF